MSTRQQSPWRWIIAGAAGFAALACAVGFASLNLGLVPANADAKPSSLERWAARTSLHATISRDASDVRDPLPETARNVSAGIKLYGANCIVCHGAADGKASNVASGLYQPAPQLGSHGVEDDPEAETHWKIAHGIRLTGMPSFDRTLTDAQIWQLTQFLAHMDKLAPAQATAWKKLPSQAPAIATTAAVTKTPRPRDARTNR